MDREKVLEDAKVHAELTWEYRVGVWGYANTRTYFKIRTAYILAKVWLL